MISVQDDGKGRKGSGELEPGETDVKVFSARPHVSKSGKESLHITLRTRSGEFINEYVQPTAWRIGLVCECFGVEWDQGSEFNEEVLVDLKGRVLTKVEPGTEQYPEPRLRVARWLKPGESTAPVAPVQAARTATPAARVVRAPERAQPAAKPKPAPAPVPDDSDIPF